MRNAVLPSLLIALAALTFPGCSDSAPSARTARSALAEAMEKERTRGQGPFVELVVFRKTDGVRKRSFGEDRYLVKFEATIEILQPCYTQAPIFHYPKAVILLPLDAANRGGTLLKKGLRKEISGELNLSKWESGWALDGYAWRFRQDPIPEKGAGASLDLTAVLVQWIRQPATLALLGMALLGLGWYAWRKGRKLSTLQSFLAFVQLLALAQIGVGGLVVPAIWKSGQSVMVSQFGTGESGQTFAYFQAYVAKNMLASSAWVIGVGVATLAAASFAAFIARRNSDPRKAVGSLYSSE